jgi:hypothetical protein
MAGHQIRECKLDLAATSKHKRENRYKAPLLASCWTNRWMGGELEYGQRVVPMNSALLPASSGESGLW